MKSIVSKKSTNVTRVVNRTEPSQFGYVQVLHPLSLSPGKAACACGGDCPRYQRSDSLQAKMQVSQPGGALEREADQAAPLPVYRTMSSSGAPLANEKLGVRA